MTVTNPAMSARRAVMLAVLAGAAGETPEKGVHPLAPSGLPTGSPRYPYRHDQRSGLRAITSTANQP